jgi:tetratricopeptide (TPR) repeat protein
MGFAMILSRTFRYSSTSETKPSPTDWKFVQNLLDVSKNHRHLTGILVGLFAAFLLTVICYWPSLNGPFLFDDIPNLELLGDRGGLTSTDKYIDFITSGQSGPLGRPLSLVSFTFNGQAWPTDPRPFRITNLLIHMVNGLLVFFLTRLIFSTVYTRETAENLALLCTTLWLLHPLLVSTTAYIVQRMTQLGGLFTLAGLLCYMRGRNYLPTKPKRGWIWIIVGLGVCGALALLSKETGILLPFYALAIELTVFSSIRLEGRHRPVLIALLAAPLIASLAYLTRDWGGLVRSFEVRDFTLYERLLTQAVVVVDYLRQIVLPQLSGLGIFHDDYAVSKGLLDPAVTLISFSIIAALLSFGVWSRKRRPLVSLGILWFFAGHSLEAGPISLELYFEHRNYLPLLGPLVAICSLLPLLSQKLRRVLPLILIMFISLECFLTWQSAAPWGNEDRLMQTALIEHPNSLRAQQHVANKYISHGQYQEALAIQQSLATKYPEHTSTQLSILNLSCLLNVATTKQVRETLSFLEHSRFDKQIAGFLGPLISNVTAGSCDALGFAEIDELFDALLRNSTLARHSTSRGPAHYFKGIAYQHSGNLTGALEQLDLAYAAKPEIDIRLQQIVWLLEAGRPDEAERYLDLARQHGKENFFGRNVREADLNILQQRIDKARQAVHQPPSARTDW